jgi:hypothetical protein
MPKGFSEQRVRSHIAESHSYFEDLEREWDRLIIDHDGEWVASYKGEFVFGPTIQEVLTAAKKKKWPFDVIAIDRLTRQRPTVLL